jgi:hypothetical protein
MDVPDGSDLAKRVAPGEGWVIDMAALREIDVVRERRATQRAVMCAILRSMMASGQVRGPMFSRELLEGDDDMRDFAA